MLWLSVENEAGRRLNNCWRELLQCEETYLGRLLTIQEAYLAPLGSMRYVHWEGDREGDWNIFWHREEKALEGEISKLVFAQRRLLEGMDGRMRNAPTGVVIGETYTTRNVLLIQP